MHKINFHTNMNHKLKMVSYFLILFLIVVSAINCSKKNKTLAELGDEKITLGEFETQYLKTNPVLDSAKNKPMDDRRQFLNLYINFRLKVKDARERGLLNNPDLQKDVTEYKKTYSPTYLIDKEVVMSEIKKLYERRKDEVRASHILINLAQNSPPQDSIAAYQKADSVIQRLKSGDDFGTVAEQFSQDRTVKQNRGDLYYFTGGMTVEEFDDAIFEMRVGDFTKKPVRTVFGLHIIKLTDRKPRLESIRASHILIQDKRDSTGKMIDSLQTYQRALDVYNKVKNGEDFGALVQQFSEDAGSKTANGDLGFFDRRRMAQPFDSAVFILKVNEVAGPVRTQYGWHVIKKTDEKKYESFEKQMENIKNEYKKGPKYKNDYNKYIEKLKKDFDFSVDQAGIGFLKSKFDSAKTIADYNLDSLFATDKEKVIAKYKDGEIKIQDIINNLNINRDYQRNPLGNQTINALVNSSAEQPLLSKKAAELKVEKDDEYLVSLKEYENGILVFRIDQDELWSKIKINDGDLMNFYEANKTKYVKADSTGKQVTKTFDEVKPELSNEMQQVKFKDAEKTYLDALRAKYPVKINDEVLMEAFKD